MAADREVMSWADLGTATRAVDFPWSAQAPVVTRPHAVRDA